MALCVQKKRWNVNNNQEQIIFPCKNNRVCVRRSAHGAYRPECMHVECKLSVYAMIWRCITWHGSGTLYKVDRNINTVKYIEIIDNQIQSVIALNFPNYLCAFQDDVAPVHRACIVESYQHENNINGIAWPAQSPVTQKIVSEKSQAVVLYVVIYLTDHYTLSV